jgi:ribosomal protein S18 acetylase RimI-like enzyme
MMQHVISVARGLGRKRILLSGGTQCRNVRAIHFYEKHGFVTVGEFVTEVKNQDMVLEL